MPWGSKELELVEAQIAAAKAALQGHRKGAQEAIDPGSSAPATELEKLLTDLKGKRTHLLRNRRSYRLRRPEAR